MKKLLVPLVLAAGFLAACSDPPPQSGYVVEKQYDDPDTWIYNQPIYNEQCRPVTQTTSSTVNGQTTTRTYTTMQCRSVFSHYVPIPMHDGPHWHLKIRDDKDPKHVGRISVSQTDFDRYAVGDHWPNPR